MMSNSKLHVGGGRSSNLELLRIVSMLLVLVLHSFWGYTHGSGLLQALDFYRECVAICAVNVFLIISGYFGIKWKFKSLFNLLFQLFFYAFAVYGVAALLGVIEFSVRGFISNITCLYTHWGFITYYLLLYLCSPLLNAFVEKVSKKQLLGFIIILVFSETFLTREYAFLNYCTMYLVGKYISKSNVVNDNQIKPGLLYWITTTLIFVFVFASFKLLHINNAGVMQVLPWGLSYAAPLVIFQSAFLFIWFARLNFQSQLVNWCAASCLSIFLIHMHPAIKEIGYYNYTEALYSLPVLEHIWKLIVLICSVFIGSILIDKIRIIISNVVFQCVLWLNPYKNKDNSHILEYIPNRNQIDKRIN